ncbi:cell wall-binding repeat-containing protein [Georgenia sp. TF02-10]|uniref:cell wall-binding repeat-containing protein n=1 Tax=Georgenia sp. TF02-10 TaxID=2917725 RepID=UPI001FA7F163|nr:cell wall-binding repeat-containing protein [Georgenia sp. TF02-10]UNX55742.1 cell wall-binding repeat-containing protein [Georgenia sp. TF02-10]
MGKIVRRGSLAAAAALAATISLAPSALADDDSGPIDIDGSPEVVAPNGPNVWRFADRDRIGTALEAAERTNGVWGGEDGNIVILATDADYPDALAAAPLADQLNAPVLLTKPGEVLDSRVADYLQDNDVDDVILASGEGVLKSGIVNEIEAMGIATERVSGVNRYETAYLLAQEAISYNIADDEYPNIFLASGTNFPDALAAGAAAAQHSGVVLLTQANGLELYTFAALQPGGYAGNDAINHREVIAIGGPAANAAPKGYLGNPVDVDFNIVGKNRYETAAMTADAYFEDPENVVVASGEGFADAIVGGAYAANVDGPLLLTNNGGLPRATINYLTGNVDRGENVFVFGGPGAVSPAVSTQIAELFRY